MCVKLFGGNGRAKGDIGEGGEGGGGSRGNERGDKQNLRYERNAKFNADDVKAKLADPSGIALVV